ncbi:hypothetical protein LOTGIDRAFT_170136 [Lottia gigantea]|uniref:Uncharacterized protein n=1 Tax=Lottia gigantea TaxID=225164 RepID=V3ZN16_LOTGI|nr:hypothetical protein LOTGIDRAFT_170136 [Lottia gigantea]ESO82231.1 hypothetical protein LOTGIDRAFT_170136 [Lottia gigantea]
MLQLRQYLDDEALKAIEGFPASSIDYEAAMKRLDEKYGGLLRHLHAVQQRKPVNFNDISGTKAELLARATGLRDLNVRPLSELQVEDLENQQARAIEKFRTPLGEKIPEPESLHANWMSNTSKIPPFRQEDIFQYLVSNKMRTFDSKCMNAKRQLKVKVFFEDKHVHSVKYNDINEQCSHCYVKCKVVPSLLVTTFQFTTEKTGWKLNVKDYSCLCYHLMYTDICAGLYYICK